MGPTAAEQADNSGPIEKRVISKNWKVRSNAFEELTKTFEDKTSKDPIFYDHVDKWKDYLKDANPGSLEKVLECLTQFLNKVPR